MRISVQGGRGEGNQRLANLDFREMLPVAKSLRSGAMSSSSHMG